MIFTRLNKSSRPSSAVAMALVLAATGALGLTALEAPASAAKKKKDEEPKPEYTKALVEVYTKANDAMNAEGADLQAVKAMVPAVVAEVKTNDDKQIAGQLIYNLGVKLGDEALQLQGLEFLADSGRLDAKGTGQVNVALYQMHRQAGNYTKARTAIERAIAANYQFDATMGDGSTKTLGADDMHQMIADLYFDQEQYAEGVAYLRQIIEARKAEGGVVPEAWLRAGVSNAYNNNVPSEVGRFVGWLAQDYPSNPVWGDAVIVTLNANQYQNAEVLDLLRLSRRLGHYNDPRVLNEYVEILDPRRYPGEVVAVIDQGYGLGVIDKTDPYLTETRKEAASRLAADKADLASLAADARKPGATLKTLVVAGDTFLSYDQPADAEEFYTKALGMSGVETPLVLTRLGIAQYDQGKYAEAEQTFRKVEGARRDIANLWAIYTAQKAAM
ncbi:tetratricopeptide repeat protein [Qipengyuania sphaerica]|uniref:tetratricopeptide repeat protein n=1 Tax=Qipengyuania sphaerica TaxID=2867243 RepID=UPI001C88DB03|nr:tetratricopeptide repeat protein [Qipengyuania sphaerica]MBX7540645.1 hypothetical protein [Qipengyuania sphaerica]